MPKWAAEIMFTSLAPSPMAKVVLDLYFCLTIWTTSAFYLGETLQHITTVAFSASSKNSYFTVSFLVIFRRDSPATITELSRAS